MPIQYNTIQFSTMQGNAIDYTQKASSLTFLNPQEADRRSWCTSRLRTTMDEKEKYDEETHFENEKWRAEAGYKFLQEIHSRQQEEMKEYVQKTITREEWMRSPEKKKLEERVRAHESMEENGNPPVNAGLLVKQIRRLLRLHMKRELVGADQNNAEYLKSIFSLFDINQDGIISRKEFCFILEKQLDLHVEQYEVDALMHHFDRDKNGKIDFNEFCQQMQQEESPSFGPHNDDFNIVRTEEDLARRATAAVITQKHWRGFLGRQIALQKFIEHLQEEEKQRLRKQEEFMEVHAHEQEEEEKKKEAKRELYRKESVKKMSHTPFTTKYGATAFHIACCHGNLEQARALKATTKNFNMFQVTNDGETALHLAAGKNHKEMCVWLLRSGLSHESKTFFGHTPVDYAYGNGHDAIVQLLTEEKEALTRKWRFWEPDEDD